MAKHVAHINVLALHGCNQVASMFENILKDFCNIAGKCDVPIKIFFTEAKYDHPFGGKTWYNKPLVVGDIGNIEYSAELVNDTMDDISKLITEHNISVLLGFSQGANVVDTYLTYKKDMRIKCGIMFCGYSLVDPDREKLQSNTPIMNIVSEQDLIVPHNLAPLMYNGVKELMKHEKGHKIPTSKPHLREICNFISKQFPQIALSIGENASKKPQKNLSKSKISKDIPAGVETIPEIVGTVVEKSD
jgi:predicted esterase